MNLFVNGVRRAKSEKENELISCVTNLKRALIASIECFLGSWGLRAEMKKRILGQENET